MFQWANTQLEKWSDTLAPPPNDPTYRFVQALKNRDEGLAMQMLNNGEISEHDVVNEKRGEMVVHVAAYYGSAMILRSCPGTMQSFDRMGQTPLHHAAMSGQKPICQMLIQEFQLLSSITVKNANGQTPYDVATSDSVRQYLLPLQLQKETQECLNNGGVGLIPGADLGGLRIHNHVQPPPTPTSFSPPPQQQTQPPPADNHHTSNGNTFNSYARSGYSSAAVMKDNSKYRPDGFHSSSSDKNLQAKYGHAEIALNVSPPPISGNANTNMTAPASASANNFHYGSRSRYPTYNAHTDTTINTNYDVAPTPISTAPAPQYQMFSPPQYNNNHFSQPSNGFNGNTSHDEKHYSQNSSSPYPNQGYDQSNYNDVDATAAVQQPQKQPEIHNSPAPGIVASQDNTMENTTVTTTTTTAHDEDPVEIAPKTDNATAGPTVTDSVTVSKEISPVTGENEKKNNEWMEYQDENGRTYYYNSISGESTWEVPSNYNTTNNQESNTITTNNAVKDDKESSTTNDNNNDKSINNNNGENEWMQYQDENGQTYYYNSNTGESSWEVPFNYKSNESTEVSYQDKDESNLISNNNENESAPSPSLDNNKANENEWEEYTDPNGQTYYYNSKTGESSWEIPSMVSNSYHAAETTTESTISSPTETKTEEEKKQEPAQDSPVVQKQINPLSTPDVIQQSDSSKEIITETAITPNKNNSMEDKSSQSTATDFFDSSNTQTSNGNVASVAAVLEKTSITSPIVSSNTAASVAAPHSGSVASDFFGTTPQKHDQQNAPHSGQFFGVLSSSQPKAPSSGASDFFGASLPDVATTTITSPEKSSVDQVFNSPLPKLSLPHVTNTNNSTVVADVDTTNDNSTSGDGATLFDMPPPPVLLNEETMKETKNDEDQDFSIDSLPPPPMMDIKF